jgi:hypothetical protein
MVVKLEEQRSKNRMLGDRGCDFESASRRWKQFESASRRWKQLAPREMLRPEESPGSWFAADTQVLSQKKSGLYPWAASGGACAR